MKRVRETNRTTKESEREEIVIESMYVHLIEKEGAIYREERREMKIEREQKNKKHGDWEIER